MSYGLSRLTTFFFCISTAYFVAFGPHGPRAPTSQPGDALKIFLSTVGLISIGTGIFFIIQSRCLFSFFFSFLFNHLNSNTLATSVPRTMTKEWQVATNDRAKEMNLNPISGQFHKELVFGSRNNIILPRYLLGGLQRLRFCFEIKKTRSFFAFVLH
jgi:hypothetical protein